MAVLLEQYAAAVAAYVKTPNEEGRERAYELGRAGISQGLGVLDMSRLHSVAVAEAGVAGRDSHSSWEFFTEVLAPFEMALRGVRDANATLKRFNQTLEERVAERTSDLEASDARLRERTELLRSVLDSMTDSVIVVDREGHVTLVNRVGADLFGDSYAGPRGVRTNQFLRFLPDETTPVPEEDIPLSRALAGQTVRDVPLYIRHVTLHHSMHIQASASPLLDADGNVTGAVAVLRDVTARRAAEDAARKAEDRLVRAQKLDAVGQLAGGVAHDFNNLLAVILSYCNLLTDAMDPKDANVEDIEQIQLAATSAAGLTRQLLAFSRQQILQPGPLSANDVVEQLARLLRRTLGENVELDTVLDASVGAIVADRGQMEQVLMNLAVNARDAMPDGGKLTIETREIAIDEEERVGRATLSTGTYVVISVSDTGMGMTEELQSRIFEPFFTTKERGRGTGLGLATVYGIVQQSGGRVSVYSEVGRGTTFRVYLPRAGAFQSAVRQVERRAALAKGTETILLVEDDERVRTVASRVLRGSGYEVLVAETPSAARTMLREHEGPVSLLVSDVVMPDTSGPALAAELLAQRTGMRVLFTSGYAAGGVLRSGALPVGASFLEKPFTADSLREKVRQVLDAQ